MSNTITKNTTKKSLFEAKKMWFVFAAISALVVSGVAFGIMQVVTATEKYYVLTTDIPARTAITPNMLEEKVVRAGSTPPNALSIGELSMNEYFSLVALEDGDILTTSTVGALTSLREGLPEDFVITSFVADPELAAAGNVKRGDYIDILMTTNDDAITGAGNNGWATTYALKRVLVIETMTDVTNEEAASSSGGAAPADGEAVDSESAKRTGIPTVYTVGLSEEDAARLAVASKYDLSVVLSSEKSVKNNDAPGSNISIGVARVWSEEAPNAGKGTDNTFGAGGIVEKPSDGTDVEEPSAPEGQEEGIIEDPVVEEPVSEEVVSGTE